MFNRGGRRWFDFWRTLPARMEKRPVLFLDRDGVINRRTPGDYVKHPREFVPETGALEALALLRGSAHRILVVTNQAGVGKGLMTASDLERVHQEMLRLAAAAGGRIDGVYFCPHAPVDGCDCRKPNPGMALQARQDFPDIDFAQSWMVGDSATDIQFGHNLGMTTVLITGKEDDAEVLKSLSIDYQFDSLLDFARFFARQI